MNISIMNHNLIHNPYQSTNYEYHINDSYRNVAFSLQSYILQSRELFERTRMQKIELLKCFFLFYVTQSY